MVTDPIADFFIQIKNGYMARKKMVVLPHSKMKEGLAKLLVKEGFLGKAEVKKMTKVKTELILSLVYQGLEPKITDMKIVSKAGKRVFVGKKEIPRVLGGMGSAILSTPLGLLTDKEARKKGVGGEVLCKIW